MKRLLSRFLAAFGAAAFLLGAAHAQMPQPPEIAARSWLLLDMSTGQVLGAGLQQEVSRRRERDRGKNEDDGSSRHHDGRRPTPLRAALHCATATTSLAASVITRSAASNGNAPLPAEEPGLPA